MELTKNKTEASPQDVIETPNNIEELQSELLKCIGVGVYTPRKVIDLDKAKKLLEDNPELFEISRSDGFKKRLSGAAYGTPEFMADIKDTFSYTDTDIEDIIFEKIRSHIRYTPREDVEKDIEKFNLPQRFADKVTDERIIDGLTDVGYRFDSTLETLGKLKDRDRVETLIKDTIRRCAKGDCVGSGGWWSNVSGKLKEMSAVDEFVKSPEMKAVALEKVKKSMATGYLDKIQDWMRFADLSPEDLKGLEETDLYLKTLFTASLPAESEKGEDPFWGFRDTRRNFYLLGQVKELFDLPDDIYDTEVFKDKIKEETISFRLFNGSTENNIEEILKRYHIDREILNTENFKMKLAEQVSTLLRYGGELGVERAQKLLNDFGVLKMSDPELRQPIIDVIVGRLTSQQETTDTPALLSLINLSDDERRSIGIKTCIDDVKQSQGFHLQKIQEAFGVVFETTSPEYKTAAEETLREYLKSGNLSGIARLDFSSDFLALPEIKELANTALDSSIGKSDFDSTRNLKKLFNFEDSIIIEIALKHLNRQGTKVNSNDEDGGGEIDVSDFIMSLKDTAPSLTVEHIQQANPDLRKYADALQARFSFITADTVQSFGFVTFLMETIHSSSEIFAALEKAPFLADAMKGNPHFAIKLLHKYSELDSLSQENIALLFEVKFDANSRKDSDEDFYQRMNEKLSNYKNNGKVIEACKKENIDMESWSNFGLEKEFNLTNNNEGTHVSALFENFERLGNSYATFLDKFNAEIRQYKEELQTKRLPSIDLTELDNKIDEMKIKKLNAELEGDQKKALGIQKGIESLEKQKLNDKGISLWIKVTSEFSKTEQKLDIFLKTFKELYDAEEELKSIEILHSDKEQGFPVFDMAFKDLENKGELPGWLKGSSTNKPEQQFEENVFKRLFAQKAKVNDLKRTCRESMGQFTKSFDTMNAWLKRDLSECLGEERYTSLLHSVTESLGLDNDHIKSDVRTIKSFFDENREGLLADRPMRIKLWDRDPDVDLYLGNYTDCCIRIDSEYHGEECVIADYLTDIGIQVAVINDEKDNKPILAAWLWVGKDKKTGKVSLIVDNIEANTDYTSQYPEVMAKNLKEYLDSYAKSIGIDSIVQGVQNNDLVVAELIDGAQYKKIGGYNRSDGYYLEAESGDDNVY